MIKKIVYYLADLAQNRVCSAEGRFCHYISEKKVFELSLEEEDRIKYLRK